MRYVSSAVRMLAGCAVALGVASSAHASTDPIAELEQDVARLEEELDTLEPGDPAAERFRERSEELREEVIYLKVKARHRQRDGAVSSSDDAELREVRRRLADLRADVDRAFGRSTALEVPAGTAIQVSLDDPVSSQTARVEDVVSCRVVRDVFVGERVAIPEGTGIRGVVRDVEPARRPSKAGRLEIEFDALFLDGERHALVARIAELEEGSGAAKKAGIGAAVGAVVGGILGGKDGAIAGVLIGGGGAVAGTSGEDVELPAGSVLTIRLERALELP